GAATVMQPLTNSPTKSPQLARTRILAPWGLNLPTTVRTAGKAAQIGAEFLKSIGPRDIWQVVIRHRLWLSGGTSRCAVGSGGSERSKPMPAFEILRKSAGKLHG